MRYLGLDLGTRTLGISLSDITLTIASTYKTIRFNEGDYDSLIPILKDITNEFNISKIILGLPKNMNNTIGDRALTTMDFKKNIEENLNIEVILQDERLTTVVVDRAMISGNVRRDKRKQKKDEMAAVVILQNYLDKAR